MVKISCEICSKEGLLQQIGRSGNYYRVRHYEGMFQGKPKFSYHQVSKNYAEQYLTLKGEIITKKHKNDALEPIDQLTIDQKKRFIDPNNLKSSSKTSVAGPMGFEPMTFSLEG